MRNDNLVYRSTNVNGGTIMSYEMTITIIVLAYMLFLGFLVARL